MGISLYSLTPYVESEEEEESEPEPEPVPPKKVDKGKQLVAKMPQKSVKRQLKEPSKAVDTKKSKEGLRHIHESTGDRLEKSIENGVIDDEDTHTHKKDKPIEENIISKDDSVEAEIIAEENNSIKVPNKTGEDDKNDLGGETNVLDEDANEEMNNESISKSDTDSTHDISSTGKHN